MGHCMPLVKVTLAAVWRRAGQRARELASWHSPKGTKQESVKEWLSGMGQGKKPHVVLGVVR